MPSPLYESTSASAASANEIVDEPYLNEHNFINAIYTLTSRRAQHQFSKEADLLITELIKVLLVRAEHKVPEILTYILVLYSRHLDFLVETHQTTEPQDDEDVDEEGLDEETLLEALVAALLISAKSSISDTTRDFRNLVKKTYINHLNSFYDLLTARMNIEELAHLKDIFSTMLSIGILPGNVKHFRFIFNNFSHTMNEDERLFAKVLFLIDRCGYLSVKTLNTIAMIFLFNIKWRVAVICSEQDWFDFIRQFKDYILPPSDHDATDLGPTPDDVMSRFEKTLQIFGREIDESSSEEFSDSSDSIDLDIDEQSASLTFAFKRMSLGEATFSDSESEEDKPSQLLRL